MGITIKDVAKRAGVSPSTVSRVIHNISRISLNTRNTVKKAMEELGYIPNAAASSLAGMPPRTLGLVLPNNSEELFKNPFFINTMRGISIYAQEKGYFLLYSFSRDEEDEVRFIKNYILSGWVSGVILMTSRENDQCVAYLKSMNFPFVLIGRPEDPQTTYWVDNDNFQAMYQVVNYLLGKGYRRIGFVGGPATFQVTRDRLRGYRQALLSRGFEVDDTIIYQGEDFSERSGISGATTLLADSRLDAIASTDDQLAFGILQKLKEAGRDTIGVTGFNNTVRGAYQSPTLTTVDINADLLGQKAAQLLIKIMENRKQNNIERICPDHHIIGTQLFSRDSA